VCFFDQSRKAEIMEKKSCRPSTVVCEWCEQEFRPDPAKNYQHNVYRKTCSKECRHELMLHKRAENVAAKRLLKLVTKKAAQAPKKVAPKESVYRRVHERACQFAGFDFRKEYADCFEV